MGAARQSAAARRHHPGRPTSPAPGSSGPPPPGAPESPAPGSPGRHRPDQRHRCPHPQSRSDPPCPTIARARRVGAAIGATASPARATCSLGPASRAPVPTAASSAGSAAAKRSSSGAESTRTSEPPAAPEAPVRAPEPTTAERRAGDDDLCQQGAAGADCCDVAWCGARWFRPVAGRPARPSPPDRQLPRRPETRTASEAALRYVTRRDGESGPAWRERRAPYRYAMGSVGTPLMRTSKWRWSPKQWPVQPT